MEKTKLSKNVAYIVDHIRYATIYLILDIERLQDSFKKDPVPEGLEYHIREVLVNTDKDMAEAYVKAVKDEVTSFEKMTREYIDVVNKLIQGGK